MRQALDADIDEAVDNDARYACKLTELGETNEAYYRDALPELMKALSRAPKVCYWAKGDDDERPSDCWETPFDCDSFRICEEHVIRDHGPDAFVLAVYAYSDSCAITASGGTFSCAVGVAYASTCYISSFASINHGRQLLTGDLLCAIVREPQSA